MADSSPAQLNPIPPTERACGRAIIALCLVCIACSLALILTFSYGRDQAIYAMVARAILSGGMPYRDAWDFKPPGIFLIFALSRALFGPAQVGIRIVEVLGLGAMIAAMVRMSGEWWGNRRIGLLAGAITVLIDVQTDFWHTSQPETFGGMATIFALAILGPTIGSLDKPQADTRDMTRRLFISGALFGFAGLLKPPLAGGGAVLAAALGIRILAERGISLASLRAGLRPALIILVGGATPFVLCLVWFALKGALGDLYQVLFVFTPHYTKLSWEGRSAFSLVYEGFTEWLCNFSSLTLVGVLLALAFPRQARERFGLRVLGSIIAMHIAGVAMQGKFFPYHWAATWPLTALIAALGFERVWERLAPLGIPGVVLYLASLITVARIHSAARDLDHSWLYRSRERLSIMTHSPRDQGALDDLATLVDVDAAANRQVSDYLRAHVPEGRPIFVWGFEPVVYDLADRPPASRYIYNVPQLAGWDQSRERDVLMSDLASKPPAAILVAHWDALPKVTGNGMDSADALQGFKAFSDLLAAHYQLATKIRDFDVYLSR